MQPGPGTWANYLPRRREANEEEGSIYTYMTKARKLHANKEYDLGGLAYAAGPRRLGKLFATKAGRELGECMDIIYREGQTQKN